MRAIVAAPGPSFSVSDVYDGWVAGLEANGIRVLPYNLEDRLEVFDASWRKRGNRWQKLCSHADAVWMASEMLKAAAYDWWPDLIVVVSGFFVPVELVDRLRARGHRLVLVATESPYQDAQQLEWAEHYDHVVLNDPTNLDQFQAVTDALYVPHAYDPARHHPADPDPDLTCDFGWVGTGYPSRIEFFEQVDWAGLDVRLGGNWQQLTPESPLLPFLLHGQDECMPNDETVRLYQSCKTSANLYRREADPGQTADGWAMGPREVELAACGTWFARDPRPEGDEVLHMLPTFTEPAELGDLVRWAVTHPEERQAAADRAFMAVADRTFDVHAAKFLKHCGL